MIRVDLDYRSEKIGNASLPRGVTSANDGDE
jgi:hypothetical protein